MRGINPIRVLALVCRDVERVKQDARFIIVVDENHIVTTLRNPHGRLSIIAVIGPGEIHENIPSPLRKFAEAVLLEIGVSRGRPYREAFGTENQRYIPKRRPWFSLTDAQYLAVAPYIFHLLKMLTDKRTSQWKYGTNTKPIYLPTHNNFFFRKKKKIESSISPKGWVKRGSLLGSLKRNAAACGHLLRRTDERSGAARSGGIWRISRSAPIALPSRRVGTTVLETQVCMDCRRRTPRTPSPASSQNRSAPLRPEPLLQNQPGIDNRVGRRLRNPAKTLHTARAS